MHYTMKDERCSIYPLAVCERNVVRCFYNPRLMAFSTTENTHDALKNMNMNMNMILLVCVFVCLGVWMSVFVFRR